jgi:hypothetical protein
MKYLKRFSETLDESSSNESHTDDVVENIKDILLPINDMGYDINVNHYIGDTIQLIIRVVTYIDKPLSITDEVKDEFMRLGDYLQSEGYNSIEAQYYTVSKSGGKSVEDLDEFITVKEPIVNLIFNAKK